MSSEQLADLTEMLIGVTLLLVALNYTRQPSAKTKADPVALDKWTKNVPKLRLLCIAALVANGLRYLGTMVMSQ